MINVEPAYEVIVCAPSDSFRWDVHDYPHHLAKWHFHPEFELHLIQRSSGQMMVGGYVGSFDPGCLVLTGPNLPHNWVSDVGAEETVPDRDMLVQFTSELAATLCGNFAELKEVKRMLDEASVGLQYFGSTAEDGTRLLQQIGEATGARRLVLFLELLARLSFEARDRRPLLDCVPVTETCTRVSEQLQVVMNYIHQHFKETIRLSVIGELCGMEVTAFSRYFKRQTGHTFARFVNQLRVHHACMLLRTTDRPVTEICFESGFNNTANFNRRFSAICRQTPSEYRGSTRKVLFS